jgi:single-strand DNA-binding protein
MVNKVIIIGNLGRNPEVRVLQSGSSIAMLNVASSESWKDKATGERKTRTEWHKIVVFNEGLINNVIEPFLRKGSKIYLEGTLATKEWFDTKTVPNVSIKRYATEIHISYLQGCLVLLDEKQNAPTQEYNAETEFAW